MANLLWLRCLSNRAHPRAHALYSSALPVSNCHKHAAFSLDAYGASQFFRRSYASMPFCGALFEPMPPTFEPLSLSPQAAAPATRAPTPTALTPPPTPAAAASTSTPTANPIDAARPAAASAPRTSGEPLFPAERPVTFAPSTALSAAQRSNLVRSNLASPAIATAAASTPPPLAHARAAIEQAVWTTRTVPYAASPDPLPFPMSWSLPPAAPAAAVAAAPPGSVAALSTCAVATPTVSLPTDERLLLEDELAVLRRENGDLRRLQRLYEEVCGDGERFPSHAVTYFQVEEGRP